MDGRTDSPSDFTADPRVVQSTNQLCFQGQYIQLTLSNTELPGVIIVKPEQETESYRVRCSKVPEEGITVTVVQEFNPM